MVWVIQLFDLDSLLECLFTCLIFLEHVIIRFHLFRFCPRSYQSYFVVEDGNVPLSFWLQLWRLCEVILTRWSNSILGSATPATSNPDKIPFFTHKYWISPASFLLFCWSLGIEVELGIAITLVHRCFINLVIPTSFSFANHLWQEYTFDSMLPFWKWWCLLHMRIWGTPVRYYSAANKLVQLSIQCEKKESSKLFCCKWASIGFAKYFQSIFHNISCCNV